MPVLLGVIAAGVLTSGCGSTTQRKWLTFFFDGVPPEGAAPRRAAAPVKGTQNGTNAVAASRTTLPKEPEMVVHKPFAEGKCSQCHGESGLSPQPKLPPRQLCFTCHK